MAMESEQRVPTAKEIRAVAWKRLGEGQYWPYLGALATMMAVAIAFGVFVVTLKILLGGNKSLMGLPLTLGIIAAYFYFIGLVVYNIVNMSLAVQRGEMRFALVRDGCRHGWRMLWVVVVKCLCTLPWYLLLIVPGVMKSFSYALTAYVSVDNPEWPACKCVKESSRLMQGHRWRLFCLAASFFGWWLLAAAVSWIPFVGSFAQLFLQPYCQSAFAGFYLQRKAAMA